MKTRLGHIIGCVTEEAGEVSQAIGKIVRFGLHDHKEHDGPSNLEKLQNEVHDLVAVYQMLCKELGEPTYFNTSKLMAKEERVEHYMEYAKSIGQLDKEG